MFTGLIQEVGVVASLVDRGPGKRLVIRAPGVAADVAIGDSVAISGCCLTVVEIERDTVAFDAGAETLAKTHLGRRRVGDRLNLEQSLRMADRLGGHFVTGHVDGVGSLAARQDDADWSTMWFAYPAPLGKQMAPKGSVAIDGVSLTLVEVLPDRFSVALIPHTLQATTLGALAIGDAVNLETDLLAKYVAASRG